MKGSTNSQWSFSNMAASPLVSFKSGQERGGTHRSYPPHLQQRASPLDKQGSAPYPIASHWHQTDIPPINQTVYLPGNASNLMTFGIGGVSPATGPIVGSTDLRSFPSISTGPCQLTIFYNGSVCVYDHVSPEKAQAIMLLAGNGDSINPNAVTTPISSTSMMQPPVPRLPQTDSAILPQQLVPRMSTVVRANPNQPASVSSLPTNDTSKTNSAHVLEVQANDIVIANEPQTTRLLGKDSSLSNQAARFSGSKAISTPITQSPLVASTSGSDIISVKPVVASVHAKCSEASKVVASIGNGVVKSAQSAVPQARKASLARFLEKRKERVISATPYTLPKNSCESNIDGVGSTFATNVIT